MPGVVLKYSGKEGAITRFHQMQEVRSILNSQNSSHLIIPKASLYKDFLVEQRLPINVDKYHNMNLYLSNKTLFDDAVRELTRLFSRLYLSDIVNEFNLRLEDMHWGWDNVRYDNLPLYLVEEDGKRMGKIGLIDLERIQKRPNPEGLQALVRIFPFHLDIIKEEASKLKMEFDEASLEDSAENGRKRLEVGFTNHLTWLKEKGVTAENFSEGFQVSPERVKELTTLLKEELLTLNQGVNGFFVRRGIFDRPESDFFTGSPEEIATELAETITPMILSNIKDKFKEDQNNKLRTIQVKEMTESELVKLRSLDFQREELFKNFIDKIKDNEKIKFKNSWGQPEIEILEQLLYVIMTKLKENDEIFYFNSMDYCNHSTCRVRY
jgi:hypothetical protein